MSERALPSRLWGVTVTDPWSDLNGVVDSLGHFPKMPIARIVFDENVPATAYAAIVPRVNSVAFVMGEILDSHSMSAIGREAYSARVKDYVRTFSGQVDLWEIGNEINGEWLGSAASVIAKISDAEEVVREAGGKTALTLYYNAGCVQNPENEMFTWVSANLPSAKRRRFDYVWISYYEDDCNGARPDWAGVFARLAGLFPDSKLGFGEVGTAVAEKKPELLQRYYTLQPDVPGFVGGYFWWYFNEDMVPRTKSLFQLLVQNAQ